ncbi:phosphotransferase family protein [Maricurvus nonylphenolicus]|uniref:phosphotransferase family protein n=1 Tax=Maricurvus nonylphenolicus TaxID=1008307 RepID=UPI0036F2A40F
MTDVQDFGTPEQWQALGDYLTTQGFTLDKETAPKRLSGGAANYNILMVMNGKKVVLRMPPPGPLPPGGNDVAREYSVLSRLGDFFPPAPKGLLLCENTDIIGVPFCISEFREGTAIGRNLPKSLTNRDNIGAELGKIVVDSLVNLHSVDTQAAGLADLGQADGFIERQINGWYKRGSRVYSESDVILHTQLHDWLEANIPDQLPSSLVHNDYKLDNMLIDLDTMELKGVVDWDMCTIGNPLYELLILLSYWGDNNDPEVYFAQCRMPCEAPGWLSRRELLDQYLSARGMSITEDELKFYWILVQYRSAVIYAQLKVQMDRGHTMGLTQEQIAAMPAFITGVLAHSCSLLNASLDW